MGTKIGREDLIVTSVIHLKEIRVKMIVQVHHHQRPEEAGVDLLHRAVAVEVGMVQFPNLETGYVLNQSKK